MRRKKITEFIYPESTPEVSRTGDIKTNDFDLTPSKMPALSTIEKQIKQAETLMNTAITVPKIMEFDRLKIAVNLIEDGRYIEFEDWGLEEDVDTPWKPPSYYEKQKNMMDRARHYLNGNDNDDNDDIEIFEIDEFETDEFEIEDDEDAITATIETTAEDIDSLNNTDIFSNKGIKRRIRCDDIKHVIGLNNLYIYKGNIVIDITGKLMASNGVLGSLNRNNIREALEIIRDLRVINFDVEKFLERANICLCDVCVDILLENSSQVARYIDGISSFFPLASNRFVIAKYDRHGLQIRPKSRTLKKSLAIYAKGKELSYSIKTTKVTRYTDIIGEDGIELANRTIRFELKLQDLKDIRKELNVQSSGFGVVKLTDVLNSTVRAILKQFKLFSGTPEIIFNRITLFQNAVTQEKLTLSEKFLAERFVELLRDNDFDINILRAHIKTEYADVRDSEIEKFIKLANIQGNILNFLVYRKPKSITIMLDVLRRLYAYYAGMESSEDE